MAFVVFVGFVFLFCYGCARQYRKLLIALWRLVTTGEVPEGVVLRPVV